jgi:hypothetical protein
MICRRELCGQASWSQDHGFQNPYLNPFGQSGGFWTVAPPDDCMDVSCDWIK